MSGAWGLGKAALAPSVSEGQAPAALTPVQVTGCAQGRAQHALYAAGPAWGQAAHWAWLVQGVATHTAQGAGCLAHGVDRAAQGVPGPGRDA